MLKTFPQRLKVAILFSRLTVSHATRWVGYSSSLAQASLHIRHWIPLFHWWSYSADEEEVFCCHFAAIYSYDIVHWAEPPLTVSIACRQCVHCHQPLLHLVRTSSSTWLVLGESKMGFLFTHMWGTAQSPHLIFYKSRIFVIPCFRLEDSQPFDLEEYYKPLFGLLWHWPELCLLWLWIVFCSYCLPLLGLTEQS